MNNHISTEGSNPKHLLTLLNNMWENYLQLNPDARRIHALFAQENSGIVVNDHIALRTFNLEKVCLKKIIAPFVDAGYKASGDYEFKEKKLQAQHFEHENKTLPKVFISELKVEELSNTAQDIINKLVMQLEQEKVNDADFCYSGRPWSVSSLDYKNLLNESEYAAWMAAFGYRPNHFTVSVNYLEKFKTVASVNDFIAKNGFQLNESGGLIKGSKDVFLEQSSTMANEVNVHFDDDVTLCIPSCFYEFAKRYPLPNGELYQGFVAASADKIFESTNVVY